jgi:signal transduction histidine kinase
MKPSEKRTKAVSTGPRSDREHRATLGSLKKIISLYAVSFLLLVTVVVGFIWHDLRAEYLDTLAYWNVQLSTSADDRVRISTLWLNERRTDTMVVAESDGTIRLLSAKGSRSQVAQIRQEVEREMAAIAAGNGFLGGAVGDGDCRIVAQTGLRSEMTQGVQEGCREVQQVGEYRVDTFGMEQGHVWLSLSAPVMAEDRASSSAPLIRRMVGSVIMVTENWQDIVPVFESESAPTRPGQTLIVWKKAREAFIFSPRLSARRVESFFRRPLAGPTFESRVALDGDVAFSEFIDYRGVRVFGVARRIGALNYSLARKVDLDAALSGHRRQVVLEQLVGALSILLFGLVMVALHRQAKTRDLNEKLQQQRALAGRLQMAREEERKVVAREIHDELGQALTAIKIDLSSLMRDLPAGKKQGSESVLNLIDQTIQSVRRISTELRPGILDDLGLVAAVEWAGEEFETRTRTKCQLDLPPEDIFIDPERATALFRILQETLTNVARHASATQVNIRLTREEGGLTLEIRDNGKGVSEKRLSAGKSLGILGMRERALLLGGQLFVRGAPGQGTVVSVRIPDAHEN